MGFDLTPVIQYSKNCSYIQEAVPHWGDRHDILSLLRACNYDPDECISIYMHLEKDGKIFYFI